MYEVLAELATDFLPVVAYGVASALITALGFLTERAGLHHLALGDQTLGIWMAGMGVVFLYAGLYMLGYRSFLSEISVARSN